MGLWAFFERQRKPHKGPWHVVGTPSYPAQLLSGSPMPGHMFAGRQGGEFPVQHLRGWWDTAEAGGNATPGLLTPQGSLGWVSTDPPPRVLGQGRWSQESSADLPPHPKYSGSVDGSTTGKSLAEWWNRNWILPAIVILHEICSGINKNIDRNCLQRVLSPFITVFRNTLMFRDTADVTWHVTHRAVTFRDF